MFGNRALVVTTALLAGLMAVVVGLPVAGGIARACWHNYDLGIYGQALERLSLADPNPWLTVRQVYVFADHVDPILWVGVPLARLVGGAWAGFIVELLCVVLSVVPLLWLARRKLISVETALLGAAVLLFNSGVMRAVHFPFHPTTWAVLPLSILCAGLVARSPVACVIGAVTLMLCKEEFPAVVLLAGFAAWPWNRRAALVLVGAALSFLVLDFVVRPMLIGDVVNYAGRFTTGLFTDPVGYIVGRLTAPRLVERLTTLLLPLVPLAAWMAWKRERPSWSVLLLAAPMLAVRTMGFQWGHHYLAVLAVPVIVALLPRGAVRLPMPVLAVTALLLADSAWSHRDVGLKDTQCPGDAARLASIDAGTRYLLEHPEGAALVEGNLLPRLLSRPGIHQVGDDPVRESVTFRHVFVEKPPHGDPWPLDAAHYEAMIGRWRATPGITIVLDDANVFLADGEFTGAR